MQGEEKASRFAAAEEIAKSLRRIRGSEDKVDAQGLRTIWHQGICNTDLASWIDADQNIIRQELTFFNNSLILDRNRRFTTGTVDEGKTARVAQAQTVTYHTEPAYPVLAYAREILKRVEPQDYYVKHLRKFVNEKLETFDAMKRTGIIDLDNLKQVERMEEQAKKLAAKQKSRMRFVLKAAAVGIGVIAGLVVLRYLYYFLKAKLFY